MLCGHNSGHLTLIELNEITRNVASEPLKDKKVEHPGGVRGIDASAFLQFYCSSGADGYVHKSWTPERILETIRESLG